MQETTETQLPSFVQEGPLEKEMATHFSILAWKIPWAEEPGRLQSTELQRVGHKWTTEYTQNEYKVMVQWCSKVHLEPLLPEELLSPAVFSEMEHIQMAASKEPSSVPESVLFYAPNAWCQDLSVRHCAESTQQLLAWTSQDLTCWALSGTLRRTRRESGFMYLKGKNSACLRLGRSLKAILKGLTDLQSANQITEPLAIIPKQAFSH